MWNINKVTASDNTITVRLSNTEDEIEVNTKSYTYTNSRDSKGDTELDEFAFLSKVKEETTAHLLRLNITKHVEDITDLYSGSNG